MYDLIIIGAGPGGIALAAEGCASGINQSQILVLEKGATHNSAIRQLYPEQKLTTANYKGFNVGLCGIIWFSTKENCSTLLQDGCKVREISTDSFASNGGFMSDDDPQSCPPDPTRRKFLVTTGSNVAASLVTAYVPALANSSAGENDSASVGAGPNIEGAVPITLRINGKDHQLRIDPRTTLLDCIRETVALSGTKKGL